MVTASSRRAASATGSSAGFRPALRVISSTEAASPATTPLPCRATSDSFEGSRGGSGVARSQAAPAARRVAGAALEAADQWTELVDQGVEVDQGVAVEEPDDAMVALDLLEAAVGVDALEEGAGAEQSGQVGEDLVGAGGQQVLDDGRGDAEFRGLGLYGAGGDQGDRLVQQYVGGCAGQHVPGLRDVDQPPSVQLAFLGEVQAEPQSVVMRRRATVPRTWCG